MLDDILMETPAFQEISRRAEEKGIEKGIEKGLREAIVSLVQARFSSPGLTRIARIQVEDIHDVAFLQELVAKIGTAQTLEQVQNLLLNLPVTENNHH
jgi:predicted transposase YdaD